MPDSNLNLLNTTVLVLAVPYFAGFVYLHGYYDFFSVSVTELNLDEAYIYVNAFTFLLNAIGMFVSSVYFVPIIFSVLLTALVVWICVRENVIGWPVLTWVPKVPVLILAYLGVSIAIYWVALSTGKALAQSHLKELRGALILRMPDNTGQDFYNEGNMMTSWAKYKYLFSSENTHFLVRMTPKGETFTVLRIPRNETDVVANVMYR